MKHWNKLDQDNFKNIAAMKIIVILKFNSFSSDTNLEWRLQVLSKGLVKVGSWLLGSLKKA